jgi:ComF family protein
MRCPPKPIDGCTHCAGASLPYRRCFAPFLYEFPVSQMILDLKYEAALANARVLGTLLGDAVERLRLSDAVDAIVPMPLHAARRVERGFNQSHEIARFVARRLGLPCEAAVLHRSRPTRPQVGLARAERIDNVRDAFRAEAHGVAGRRIALVDDVVTTGSTAAEAARALLAGGATIVDVWAVARAPGHD